MNEFNRFVSRSPTRHFPRLFAVPILLELVKCWDLKKTVSYHKEITSAEAFRS